MNEICINPGFLFTLIAWAFLLGALFEIRANKKWNADKRKPFG